MPLTRKSKIVLIIAAVPLVLIVAAIVVLKIMITSDKLKAMIIPRVEEATHRSVAIRDIELTLFPTIGVNVDGLTISNRKWEGFSETPFLGLDHLHLNVKIIPLFRGRVEVTSVTVDRARLLIETNDHNETNYADLSGPPAGSKVSGQSPNKPPSVSQPSTETTSQEQTSPGRDVSISSLLLHDGMIDYVNFKENSATRIRGINLNLSLDWQSGKLTIASKASVDSLSYGSVETPIVSGLKVALAPLFVYDMPNDELTIEQGDIILQAMSLSLTGSVKNVRKDMTVDLNVGSDKLNIAELLSLVPKEYMKNAEGLSGDGTAAAHIRITGTISDSSTADVEGHISATGARVQYAKLPKPISNITILADFTRSRAKQEFRIEKLTANLGENPIGLSMTVLDFTDPSMTLAVTASMNLAQVREFYPLEQGTDLSGTLSADVNVAGKVKDPSGMKAGGSLVFHNVTAKTASAAKPVQDLNGTIQFNNQIVESKNLSMTVGKTDLSLAFWLKNYLSLMSTDKNAPRPAANLTLQSRHLYTADIMRDETKGEPPSQSAVKTPAPQSSQQLSTPQGNTTSARTTLPFPTMEIDVTGTVGTFTMQNYEFSNVRMMMHIANGIVTMQNFSLNAFDGSVISKGSVNMQKPEKPLFDMALDVNGVDAPTMLSHFTSFGKRLRGRLTMNTTMKGALNDTLGLVPTTLDGNGKVQIQNGSLEGFKVSQSIASALKLPDLDTIAFKDWSNSFIIKDGRILIKDLKITALNADYVVNGSQGIDGSLDYVTALYLPENSSSKISVGGFAGEAVKAFKDPSGRLRFDFNVGGTTDDPKVQLNTDEPRKRVEDLVKQKVQDEAKKLGDQATKKVGDALRNLFKGKK